MDGRAAAVYTAVYAGKKLRYHILINPVMGKFTDSFDLPADDYDRPGFYTLFR